MVEEENHLVQELSGVHELTGAICDVSTGLLSSAVVLQVLVLNVVPSSHHKHKCLQERGR